jgi:hypothetical protein
MLMEDVDGLLERKAGSKVGQPLKNVFNSKKKTRKRRDPKGFGFNLGGRSCRKSNPTNR